VGNARGDRGRACVADPQFAAQNAGFPAPARDIVLRMQLAIGCRGERREGLGAARHDCLLFVFFLFLSGVQKGLAMSQSGPGGNLTVESRSRSPHSVFPSFRRQAPSLAIDALFYAVAGGKW
jgi:hypothetical protein